MSSDDWAVVLSVVAILISLVSAGIAVLTARDFRRAARSFDKINPTRPVNLKDIT